jgi:hypothetical protein
LKIVGESRYLETFIELCGARGEHGVNLDAVARVECENHNRYDPLAVVVKIDDRVVGYLSRLDARLFRAAMDRCQRSGDSITCQARIRGGWDNGCGDTGDYGVTLALDIEQPV